MRAVNWFQKVVLLFLLHRLNENGKLPDHSRGDLDYCLQQPILHHENCDRDVLTLTSGLMSCSYPSNASAICSKASSG